MCACIKSAASFTGCSNIIWLLIPALTVKTHKKAPRAKPKFAQIRGGAIKALIPKPRYPGGKIKKERNGSSPKALITLSAGSSRPPFPTLNNKTAALCPDFTEMSKNKFNQICGITDPQIYKKILTLNGTTKMPKVKEFCHFYKRWSIATPQL